MTDWRPRCVMLTLAVLAGATGSSGGLAGVPAGSLQPPGAATASLGDIARELNDERFEIREAVTRRLIDDTKVKADDIMEFVRAQWDTLAPESIERLLIVARERAIANPGAIGIEFGPSTIATVDRVVSGTPAERVLQRGDQIVSLNGEELPLTNSEQRPELLRRMAEFKAGDVVQARIRRGGQDIDVEFALADPKLLPRFESFIVSMQREMLQRWDAKCSKSLPPPQCVMIDMDVVGLSAAESNPRAASVEGADAKAIEELSRRRAEVSQAIAQVLERSSSSDSPERRQELQGEYLSLRSEFARLNARLRMLQSDSVGRGR